MNRTSGKYFHESIHRLKKKKQSHFLLATLLRPRALAVDAAEEAASGPALAAPTGVSFVATAFSFP